MQLGNDFQGKKCACCHRTIHSEPEYRDNEWYHKICYEQAVKEFQHAQEIAYRFAFVSL